MDKLHIKDLKTDDKNRFALNFLLVCILLMICLSFGISWLGSSNNWAIYGCNAISRLYPQLFTNDFAIESVRHSITPQIIGDLIVGTLIKIIRYYPAVMLLLFFFCIYWVIRCLYFLMLQLGINDKEKLILCPMGMIIFLCIRLGYKISGNSILSIPYFTYQLAGITFALWALVYTLSKEKNWWLIFGLCLGSVVFHFHVGAYLYLLLNIIFILNLIQNKTKFSIRLILPNITWLFLAGIYASLSNTSSTPLTNWVYVEIYGRLALPFHIIPSTFESTGFISYFATLILFSVFGWMQKDKMMNYLSTIMIIMAPVTAILLLVNYWGTDIVPLSFIVKLQPTRFATVVDIWAIIFLVYLLTLLLRKKRFVSFWLLMTGMIMTNEYSFTLFLCGALLCELIGFLGEKYLYIEKTTLQNILFLLFLALGAFTLFDFFLSGDMIRTGLLTCVFLLLLFYVMHEEKHEFSQKTVFLYFSLIAISTLVIYFNYRSDTLKLFYSDLPIIKADTRINRGLYYSGVDIDLLALGKRFEKETDVDAVFFADPLNDRLLSFRLYSLRSIVISAKGGPISEEGLLKWKDMMMECGELIYDGEHFHYNRNAYQENTADFWIDYAQKYQADYILVNTPEDRDRFLAEGRTELLDSEGRFSILKILPDGQVP